MDAVNVCNISLVALGQSVITALTDENENARRCNAVYETVRDDLMTRHPWNFATKRALLIDITKPDMDSWAADTDYEVDDEVVYNDVHYKCLVAHTSGVFSVDLASGDWSTLTDWVTATQYIEGDIVYHTGVAYACVTNHTSGTWATDLAAVKWVSAVKAKYEFTYAYRLPTDLLRPLSFYGNYTYKIEGGYLYTNETSVELKYIASITDPDDWSAEFVMALAYAIADMISLAVTSSRTIASDIHAAARERLSLALAVDAQGGGTPDEPEQNEWIGAR